MCMPLRLPDICIWTRLNMSCNLLTVLGWGRTPSIETASWTHETLFCVRCACEEVQDKAHALLMCRDADVCALRRKFVPIQSILKEKKRKERLRRQQYTPCNNKGKGDTLAWSAVSLPHQRKKETVGIWGWLAAPCSRPRPWEQLVFSSAYARGVVWGPNGYTFCMLLGYGPPDLQVSSSALISMQLSLKRES